MKPNTSIISVLVNKIRSFFKNGNLDGYIPDRLKAIADAIRRRKY